MNFSRGLVAAFLVALFTSGCVTREDIRGIQTDLYTIQQGIDKRLGNVTDQTENVQTAQADLLTEIHELRGSLVALQSNLNDYQHQMEKLAVRLDDLEVSLSARMDAQIELLSGSKFVEKPLPSTSFNLANTDYARGRYREAIKGFEFYVKQFPKGGKVSEAKLKIADCKSKQGNTAEAIQAYDELIAAFPKDSLVPTALIRKAASLESLGKKSEAIAAYTSLIKTYPYSPEADSARGKIQTLRSDNKP
jgi:tol-pal system protein YbgF